ncbi:MAG TPA: hypothetical protein VNW94_16905 [Streptosporangiaceae bacterium]|nr:hypothetical protein [Streptosporangiaceae bacterium]
MLSPHLSCDAAAHTGAVHLVGVRPGDVVRAASTLTDLLAWLRARTTYFWTILQ